MRWNEVYENVRRFTDRAAEKINRSADIAALQMKLSMAEKRLRDAYETLGRIAYRHFTGDEDLSGQVSAAVAEAERIHREIKALEEQIAYAKKNAAEADAAARRSNGSGGKEQPSPDTGKGSGEADAGTAEATAEEDHDTSDAEAIPVEEEENE